MAKNIEPKLKLISGYLKIEKNEYFVIPEYQRAYSWTIVQCDELFRDIEEFAAENDADKKDPYFFGTIIVDCSQNNEFSLIDGQQRTTTFLLLFKAVLFKIQEKLEDLKGLQKDEENESLIAGLKERRDTIIDILYKTDVDSRMDFLKDWNNKVANIKLLENRSNNENDKYKEELLTILGASTYTEAEAKDKCYQNTKKHKENKYTAFFRNFKFFYDKLSQYGESKLNKFAKTLLGKCQVIEIRSWQFDQAIAMFNSLNGTGLPLTDADIISAKMHYYAEKYEDEKDKIVFKNNWKEIQNLTEALNAKKIIHIDSVLQEYMYIRRAKNNEYKENEVTMPGVRNYYTLAREENGKSILEDPNGLSDNFLKITKIWDKIQSYPMIKLSLKFNENIKIYLMSYLNRYELNEITEDKVAEIAETLIRLFTILELVDVGYSSSNFKTFLFNQNLNIVDDSVRYLDIKAAFDKQISEKWQKEDIRNLLEDYDKNVLVFLNEYLYAKENNLSFDFDDNVNIEHIMPSSWKKEFVEIVNSLGNKILLEEDINKSIGNNWFMTKKQKTIKEKAGYNNSKYNIARSLVDYPSDLWTVEDIEKARAKAIDRIVKFIFGE